MSCSRKLLLVLCLPFVFATLASSSEAELDEKPEGVVKDNKNPQKAGVEEKPEGVVKDNKNPQKAEVEEKPEGVVKDNKNPQTCVKKLELLLKSLKDSLNLCKLWFENLELAAEDKKKMATMKKKINVKINAFQNKILLLKKRFKKTTKLSPAEKKNLEKTFKTAIKSMMEVHSFLLEFSTSKKKKEMVRNLSTKFKEKATKIEEGSSVTPTAPESPEVQKETAA